MRSDQEKSFRDPSSTRTASRLRTVSLSVNERVFEIVDDHRAGKVVVNLTGRLNKCGVISPRFDVQLKGLGDVAEKPPAFSTVWDAEERFGCRHER